MLVRYDGPPDQHSHEVALALAAKREPVDVELPDLREYADEGATIVASGVEPASGTLEPGRVYDLPHDLATSLVKTSAWWHRETSFEQMSKAQLLDIAGEREIEGRSKMTKAELVAALRLSDSAAAASDASNEEAPGSPGTAPASTAPAPAPAPAPATTTGGAT